MKTRENDFEHYVKCHCGWEGFSAWMIHGYEGYGHGEDCDVEPMDYCPKCRTPEIMVEAIVECHGDCLNCSDRFLCLTVFDKLPVLRKHYDEDSRQKSNTKFYKGEDNGKK